MNKPLREYCAFARSDDIGDNSGIAQAIKPEPNSEGSLEGVKRLGPSGVEMREERLPRLEADLDNGGLDIRTGESWEPGQVGDGNGEVWGIDAGGAGEVDAEVFVAQASTDTSCSFGAQRGDGERGC